jgi:hypothetical protein
MPLDIRKGTMIPTKRTESKEYVKHIHYHARMLTSQTTNLSAYTPFELFKRQHSITTSKHAMIPEPQHHPCTNPSNLAVPTEYSSPHSPPPCSASYNPP